MRCSPAAAAGDLGDTERADLRKQALDWLRVDLAAYAKMRDGGAADKQQFVGERLRHWQTDADLAGIRDEAALGKLPAAEREDWRRLWADVAALLKDAK
jgi:hypothetical protein